MGELIGRLIPLALGVAASPIPLLAILIMLTSQKALKNAISLIAGWVLVMMAIGLGGILIFAGREFKGIGGAGGHVDDVANLVVGAVLLVLSAVRYAQLRRGTIEGGGIARLLDTVDRIRPSTAIALGALTIFINPKNILVTLSGIGLILASGQSFGGCFLALVLFVVLATSSLAVPVVLCLVAPRRSAAILSDWRDWLLEHNQQVVVYLLLLLGVLLMAIGIWGLTS